MKRYNTKDIYFGCLTYNAGSDGYYHTSPEPFIKTNYKYLRLNSKKQEEFCEFYEGTSEYLTVSNLFPLVDMNDKIQETMSRRAINMYLMKYIMTSPAKNEIKTIDDYRNKVK